MSFMYPLVLHLCVSTGHASFGAYYLAALLLFPMLAGLLSRRRVSSFAWACALGSIALLTVFQSNELLVFKVLPVTVYLAFFGLFAASLRPGVTPLVVRIAAAIRGDLSAVEAAYARHATVAWAIFLFVMGLISALLAVFAGDSTWSWFVNVAGYILVASFFAIEFAVRRHLLRNSVDYGFSEFLGRLARVDVSKLLLGR